MLKLLHLFMLFSLCNTTSFLYSMNNDLPNHWNEDSDTVRHYRETKNLAKQKKERQKKHQGPSSKKKHIQTIKIQDKKTTK